MPHYRKHGKIQIPLSDQEFIAGMTTGKFCSRKHKGFVALLFYSAVRKSEALKATKEQFTVTHGQLYFDVGTRLKGSMTTGPLNIPVDAPYVEEILWAVEQTEQGRRVWPYSKKTGYNIVARAFKYPHWFRLSRITRFFLAEWSIAEVRSWTGLSLKALDYYVGLVSVQRMGESLRPKQEVK